jgi:hypothetical protein
MQIQASSVISHPRSRVLVAFRDELPSVAAFMPNIREIVTVKREPTASGVKVHNEWHAKGEIPKVIKLRVFSENVKCSGRTTLTDEGSGTRIALSGSLDLDLRNIPGVPRFLAGTLGPQVEKFVVGMITPNLEQMNASLAQYLDAQR